MFKYNPPLPQPPLPLLPNPAPPPEVPPAPPPAPPSPSEMVTMRAWASSDTAAIADMRISFPDGNINTDMTLFKQDYIQALAVVARNTPADSMVVRVMPGSLVVQSWTKFKVRLSVKDAVAFTAVSVICLSMRTHLTSYLARIADGVCKKKCNF